MDNTNCEPPHFYMAVSAPVSNCVYVNVCMCAGITCPLLLNPDNGQVIVDALTVRSTAQYVCREGFVLQGSAETTCLPSGRWSSQPPLCIAVDCPDLPEPLNGEIIYSRVSSETVNVFGTAATYRSPLSTQLNFHCDP